MNRRRQFLALTAAAPWLCSATLARAQSHPIRLIVPYVPGGGTDTLARMLAPLLGEALGESVVVDNRAGGGSTIGTMAVARAQPDGHTMGLIDAAFVTNPALYRTLPYDSRADFIPISLVATSPLVFCIHPDVAARSIAEVVALARQRPGELTFGSAGVGGATHMAGEQFRIAAGIDIVHVPYKGAGQQLTDLVGGQTTMGFFVPGIAKPHVDSGRLLALGVTGPAPSPLFPNAGTFAQAGYPGVSAAGMNGLIVPKGTPADFVQRVNRIVADALASDTLRQRLTDAGFVPAGGPPSDFTAYLDQHMNAMSETLKAAGIEPLSL